MAALTPEQARAARIHLATNFEAYAPRILKILPKAGGNPVPFVMNEAQLYFHRRIEEQKASIGKVRALALKGRQQGISTYTEGRFFHKLTHQKGKRVGSPGTELEFAL